MRVESYQFGKMKVDGHCYTKDLLLLPPRIVSPWWRKEGHQLNIADLEQVLMYHPQTLIVGTGASGGMKISSETQLYLETQSIQLVTLFTDEAWHCFNRLTVEEEGRIAAAFHLTC